MLVVPGYVVPGPVTGGLGVPAGACTCTGGSGVWSSCQCRPLAITLTVGQDADSPQVIPSLKGRFGPVR
jgi:hypothetical protein